MEAGHSTHCSCQLEFSTGSQWSNNNNNNDNLNNGGSQCSCHKTSEMCLRRPLPVIRRAAACCTDIWAGCQRRRATVVWSLVLFVCMYVCVCSRDNCWSIWSTSERQITRPMSWYSYYRCRWLMYHSSA